MTPPESLVVIQSGSNDAIVCYLGILVRIQSLVPEFNQISMVPASPSLSLLSFQFIKLCYYYCGSSQLLSRYVPWVMQAAS